MAKQTVRVLQPTFYDKFSCTGPACPSNCCHSWNISVDKASYLRCQSTDDHEIAEICKHAFELCSDSPADEKRHALIKHNTDGMCPFLDADNLCLLHKRLGAECLSVTCMAYPRTKNLWAQGEGELSLYMSCYEAARLALYEQNETEFEIVDKQYDTDDHQFRQKTGVFHLHESQKGYQDYAVQIRNTCIDIMQSRQCTVSERILVICMMLQEITGLYADSYLEGIFPALENYFSAVQNGECSGVLGDFLYDEAAHLSSLRRSLIRVAFKKRESFAKDPSPIHDRFLQSLGLTPADTVETIEQKIINPVTPKFIAKGISELCDPYFAANPTVLENYFVSYIFSSLFPFRLSSETLTPEQNGFILAEHYAMIRAMISGVAQHEGGITQEIVLRVISFLARGAQHSNSEDKLLADYARSNRLDGLADAIYMLW